ncbi:MAG: hypothetical protein GEV28_17280 [Actinophytocola sp.]|uniref:hypothetical protein n=1 Tax=Actinophytocola sp. TaxID=1872138 RepID=UPI001323239B|nr:hypothetical protein [Actinophytocola sp.]MPZ82043.1 hypothetical protein [Actinophytocola sp.]
MKKWIFCLVVGLGLLAFGAAVNGNDKTVRCDGQLMQPSDVCEYRTRGGDVTSSETYDEVKAGNESARRTFDTWGRWALLGGGLALTGLGVWGIVRTRRRRKAQDPTTADLFLQQQAAHSGAGYTQPPHTPPHGQDPPQAQYPPQAVQQPGPPAQQPRYGPGQQPQPAQQARFGPGQQPQPAQQARFGPGQQPQPAQAVPPWPPQQAPMPPGPPPPVGTPGYGTHPWGSAPPPPPPGPHPNFGPGADEDLTERY